MTVDHRLTFDGQSRADNRISRSGRAAQQLSEPLHHPNPIHPSIHASIERSESMNEGKVKEGWSVQEEGGLDAWTAAACMSAD